MLSLPRVKCKKTFHLQLPIFSWLWQPFTLVKMTNVTKNRSYQLSVIYDNTQPKTIYKANKESCCNITVQLQVFLVPTNDNNMILQYLLQTQSPPSPYMFEGVISESLIIMLHTNLTRVPGVKPTPILELFTHGGRAQS